MDLRRRVGQSVDRLMVGSVPEDPKPVSLLGPAWRNPGPVQPQGCAEGVVGAGAATPDGQVAAVGEVFPAFGYHREMPLALDSGQDPFARDLWGQYEAWNSPVQGPPAVLFQLLDAVLARDVIYLRADGAFRPVRETFREVDRPYTTLVDPRVLVLGRRPRFARAGVNVYVGSVGSGNWGHWLVDDLPRLAGIRLVAERHPREPITLVLSGRDSTLNRRRAESVAMVLPRGLPHRIRFLDRRVPARFDRLYCVSPVSSHPLVKSPLALAWVRAAAVKAAGEDSGRRSGPGSRRLLVVRRGSRGLVNGPAVEQVLRGRGFQVFDPARASAAEQCAAFGSARVVCGVMGAGMANTVFMPAGSAVIQLAAAGWKEPFFWDLAAVCGHRYAACYGSSGASADPPQHRQFTVSPAALQAVLDQVTD